MLTVFCLTTLIVRAQTMRSFKFTAGTMGWDENEEDFEGIIDHENLTITFTTQRWIENIAQLTAIFEVENTDACEVKVGNTVQISGETANDFHREVIYTICRNVQYTVRFESPQATGLPYINIRTQNEAEVTSKDNWTNMTSFVLIDPNEPSNSISKGPYSSSQFHRIRGRGNSTWNYPKKPYRVGFREDVSLFGLEARQNWVLLADYLDPTFLTTAIGFELGTSIFPMPFTCTYRNVHLYYNNRYDGLYTLTEHRQADPNGATGAPGRVGIDQVNGGWFIEIDNNYDEEPKFRTANYDLPVMIKSPEYAPNPTESDNPFYDFVKNDMNELCDSLVSPGFPGNGYSDLIDMNAFIDYLMINEITFNHELRYPRSLYAYKIDKDAKISLGPLWDFDWGFSYATRGHAYFTGYASRLLKHDFLGRFYEDPIFAVKYKERWNEKYDELVLFPEFIENQGAKINQAAAEDAKRWIIPDGYGEDYNPDHAQQIENMKSWWDKRIAWLNNELNKVEVMPKSKNFGTISSAEEYAEIALQTSFSLVSYEDMDDLSVRVQKGGLSEFRIVNRNIQTQATGDGGYLATCIVKLNEGLPYGRYSDVLILSGTNQGKAFSLNVPLNFTYKLEQELLVLNEMEDKAFGDDNFFLTTEGGSGNGAVTFSKISGNATIDEKTGEVRIDGVGKIVVMATKAEDATYQPIQSQELTFTVAKGNPPYIVPTGLTAIYGNFLSDVELPEHWKWEDETAPVGDFGMQTHKAVYTPEDTINYLVVSNIDVTVTVNDITGNLVLTPPTPLRAWMRNGLLHITGIIPGKTLNVYNMMGALVYQSISTADKMDIPLRTRGVYFVRAGNNTVKVVSYKIE